MKKINPTWKLEEINFWSDPDLGFKSNFFLFKEVVSISLKKLNMNYQLRGILGHWFRKSDQIFYLIPIRTTESKFDSNGQNCPHLENRKKCLPE